MPALCQERHEQAQEDTLTEAMGRYSVTDN